MPRGERRPAALPSAATPDRSKRRSTLQPAGLDRERPLLVDPAARRSGPLPEQSGLVARQDRRTASGVRWHGAARMVAAPSTRGARQGQALQAVGDAAPLPGEAAGHLPPARRGEELPDAEPPADAPGPGALPADLGERAEAVGKLLHRHRRPPPRARWGGGGWR
jgi:hypothetical protein